MRIQFLGVRFPERVVITVIQRHRLPGSMLVIYFREGKRRGKLRLVHILRLILHAVILAERGESRRINEEHVARLFETSIPAHFPPFL